MTGAQTTSSGTPSGRSRWMFYALIASLAFNALAIGGAATAAWRFYHHGSHHFGGKHGGIKGFLRQLPAERRNEFHSDMKAAKDQLRPLRREVRAAWDGVNDAISRETFDRSAAEAAIAKLEDAERKFKSGLTDALLNVAAKLTPEERKELRAWQEKRKAHRKKRREDRRERRGDDGAD